jgi:hypothetical protein
MYTAATVRTYAAQLGVDVEVNTHDSGQTWTLEVLRGEASGYTGPFTIRASYEWGEEDRHFARLNEWLNGVPWPSEDDPRVAGEY